MKKVHFAWIQMLIMLFMLTLACDQPEKINSSKEEKATEDLKSANVPEGFSYDNYVQVEMVVQFYDNFDRLLKNQVFEVYTEDERLILTATTDEFGRYVGRLTLSKVSSNLIVRASRIGLVNDKWTMPVTGTSMNISIKY